MSTSWIGIGANVGDARAAFDAAWRELGEVPAIQLLARSGLYHTTPVGPHAGGQFSNAVFSLNCTLRPLEQLDLLQDVENRLGRTRDMRWGPRPIDLDLLFVDQLVLAEPRLTLPHPAAWYRRFVLDPLSEIAPTLQHPVLKLSVTQLLRRLAARPLIVACRAADWPRLAQPAWKSRFPQIRFAPLESLEYQDSLESVDSRDGTAAVCLRLNASDPTSPICQGIPVADLTGTPGDADQRVADFLQSILDQPVRYADW